MPNPFHLDGNAAASGTKCVAVSTASDVVFGNARPKYLLVTGAGNVVVDNGDGTTCTVPVLANSRLDLAPYGVKSSGTTATGLIAVY